MIEVRFAAPLATAIDLVVCDDDGSEVERLPLRRDGDDWVGEVGAGTRYGLIAEGEGPRFDSSKILLDPRAVEVWFPPALDRNVAKRPGVGNTGRAPLAVARELPGRARHVARHAGWSSTKRTSAG